MTLSKVGKRYAKALYDLAAEADIVDKIGKDLNDIAATWAGSDEIRDVFESPRFSVADKRKVIAGVATRAGVHQLLKNTLQMLSDRQRLRHVGEIADAFQRIHEERAQRVRVEVTTASRLSEAYFTKLQETVKEATGKEVVLVRKEDPSLIGGVVMSVGGRVFDGSLKNRLQELRKELLASSLTATSAEG